MFLPARPAAAAPPDTDLGEAAVFLPLFPNLRTLPAPGWLRPGVRASYDTSSAIIGGGGAGAGIIQYDIAANDGEQALISVQTFGYIDNNVNQPLIPLGWSPKVGLPALGEFWIHPTVLVNAERVANPNLSVVRTTRNLNGNVVQVVRFQSSLSGATTVWEFSVNSGILVFYRNSTPNPSTGGSLESQSILRERRTVNLPWAQGTAPNWVRPEVRMDYGGWQYNTIAGAGGRLASPYHVFTRIAAATRTWSVTQGTIFLNGIQAGGSIIVSGPGLPFGGYWLPRTALQLQLSTTPFEFDRDFHTGVRSYIRRGNGNSIVMRQEGAAFVVSTAYEPTLGSLEYLYQNIATPTNIMEIEIWRTGGSNLNALNSQPPPAGSPPGDLTPDPVLVYLPAVRN
jgi:hypothetical protein